MKTTFFKFNYFKTISFVLGISFTLLYIQPIKAQTPLLKVVAGDHSGKNAPGRTEVGSENYSWLGFGSGYGNKMAIDYYNRGLNVWTPYPSSYSGNYKLFIHETGPVSINGAAQFVDPIDPLGNQTSPIFTGLSGNITKPKTVYHLQVYGNALASSWSIFSDASIKQNITPLEPVLAKILNLNTISYQ